MICFIRCSCLYCIKIDYTKQYGDCWTPEISYVTGEWARIVTRVLLESKVWITKGKPEGSCDNILNFVFVMICLQTSDRWADQTTVEQGVKCWPADNLRRAGRRNRETYEDTVGGVDSVHWTLKELSISSWVPTPILGMQGFCILWLKTERSSSSILILWE